MKRRSRVREQQLKLDLMEIVTAITRSELNLLYRKRVLDENSCNLFNHIGPLITAPPHDEAIEWHLTVEEKRQFLEGDCRKDAGGLLAAGMLKDAMSVAVPC